MKKSVGMVVVSLVFLLPATVLALAMETFGNAPVGKQPDWAEGVVHVVNLKSRVYSYWVNGNENFFYRGDAAALNAALRQYAAVKSDVRQVILLPGTGKTHSFERKPIPFDWQLHVPSGIYKAVSQRQHAVMTVYIGGAKPRPLDGKQVESWLGDLSSDAFKVRDKATQELQKLGNDAKPFLRTALKAQRTVEARRRIESLLDKLRDIDATDLEIPKGVTIVTVDDLLAANLRGLQEKNSTVSGMAAQDLSALAPYSDKVVPALTEMLAKDKNEWVRRVAAGCLASAGAKAKSALPALRQGRDDADAAIRDAFKSASEHIENAKETTADVERINRERTILQEINELKRMSPNEPAGQARDTPGS